jgi:hypothetical protein
MLAALLNSLLETENGLPVNSKKAEVKYMRKAQVAIPIFAFLMLFMMIAPALATSPKKIAVTLARSGWSGVPDPNAWVTEGGIRHVRGEILGAASYAVKQGSTTLFSGKLESIWNYNFNVETGVGAGMSKSVITLPSGDTFEGKITSQGTFRAATSGGTQGLIVKSQGVFQGTGNYQGWTFQYFSETGQPTEAYLLIP